MTSQGLPSVALTALVLTLSQLVLVGGFLFTPPDAKVYPREPVLFWGESLQFWCNRTSAAGRRTFDLTMSLENIDNQPVNFTGSPLTSEVGGNVYTWVNVTSGYFTTYVSHVTCDKDGQLEDSTVIYAERPLNHVRDVLVSHNSSHVVVSWSHGAEYIYTPWIHTHIVMDTGTDNRTGQRCDVIDGFACYFNNDLDLHRPFYIRVNVTLTDHFLAKRPPPGDVINQQLDWRSSEFKVDPNTWKVESLTL